MNTFFVQFFKVWQKAKWSQRAWALLIMVGVIFLLGLLLFKSSSSSFVPLYKLPLSSSDLSSIRSYLEIKEIPFKDENEKIFVLEEHAERLRSELSTAGIFKLDQTKGFELFDSNTWIKGEKELQVLEMRALKGQLEKDLMAFEHVKNANVILDIPPARSFGGSPYKTKASVILTLMPGSHLSVTQLRAIVNHLAGAVRGLEANMIAISDTTGKLYKSIDPENKEKGLSIAQLHFEENVQEKIDQILTKMVGKEHFCSSFHALFDPLKDIPSSLFVSITVDQSLFQESSSQDKLLLKNEIEKHIKAGLTSAVEVSLDLAPFAKKRNSWVENKEKHGFTGLFLTIFVFLLTLISIFPLFKRFSKKEKNEVHLKKEIEVNFEKLADTLRHEDPAAIAMMISYMEPTKAEKLMRSFPEKLQEEILEELEKEI